jgi:hypothetical protein
MCNGLSITDFTGENTSEVGDTENPLSPSIKTRVDSLQLLVTSLQEEVFFGSFTLRPPFPVKRFVSSHWIGNW